jgi:NhaP-type Na+/H+ or K+/H+ antiporter
LAALVILVALSLVGYAMVSKRLATTSITGPMVFVALGLVAAWTSAIDVNAENVVTVVDVVLQATLILVLFTDAAALHFSSWRKDAELPGRLLGIGLPLTIALGALIAAVLLTDLSIWEAAIIGAIIAPTDAALGQAVISNPRVPGRIRQALDVESGLNDGVSLPFVLIFIGLAEESEGTGAVLTFVREIGVAVAVGVAVGFIGGWLVVKASQAEWMGHAWGSIAVVAIAVTAFVVADVSGGSGFIATFVAGLAYGNATRDRIKANESLAANLGLGMVQVSFLLFGALVLEPAMAEVTWQVVLMALLALTIARMGPVALSMIGANMHPATILYMGWFGPRGLATIVFAALVVTDADLPGTGTIVTVATITVGLSVLLHGLTAYPGSQRYANWYASHDDPSQLEESKPVHRKLFRSSRLESRPAQKGSTDGPVPPSESPS